jgi:hypothetical protein
MYILVDAGANVNLADKEGETPLMVATQNGNIPGIKYLLENEADVSAETTYGKGKTAMSMAVRDGRDDAVEILKAVAPAP